MKSAPSGQPRLDQTVAGAAASGDPLCPFAQAEQLVAVTQDIEAELVQIGVVEQP